MKIHILGGSGSGKTTLAKDLSARFRLPHYDLDQVDWEKESTLAIAEQPGWITEGIYLIFTEPLLYHADCIILLTISWPRAAWRIVRRHMMHSLRGTNPYPGINGVKALIKLLTYMCRYSFNLDQGNIPSIEALDRYVEAHRDIALPPTEGFMQMYIEAYNECIVPPTAAFVRRYLEKYQEKMFLVKSQADRTHLLELLAKREHEREEEKMSLEKKPLSREDLLAALEKGWKHYLSQLQELSEEEQAHYAKDQGFSRIQDVLVHIFAWWERSRQRALLILDGHSLPRTDVDAFNAAMVEQYQQWTRQAIEEKFATALTELERFLRDLPETALEHERIQLWLRIDAHDHYEDHRLPNEPA